jgi:RHS repeat-associated protein
VILVGSWRFFTPVHEERCTTCDWSYEYDQAGNRTSKVDNLADREWVYVYDTSDPGTYGSNNNRLMEVEEYDTSGNQPVLEFVSWYFYSAAGNVTRVVRHEEGTEEYTAHRIDYGINGEVVLYVMDESWEWDGEAENCPTDYAVSYAREFRYDNAMQRYMNIEFDPTDDFEPIETVWTDYDGDRVYGDYEVVNSALADVKSFEPGIGFVDDPTGTPAPGYYHGDMLGTTRRTTNASAAQVDNAAYTAFGEFLGGSTDRRYGFAGAWQYQSHPATGFPYLHVGHRYYDPAIGRFLQRDPIGILGGANVYSYARNHPASALDPLGLFSLEEGIVGGLCGLAICRSPHPGLWAGCFAAGFIAGGYQEGDAGRLYDWVSGLASDVQDAFQAATEENVITFIEEWNKSADVIPELPRLPDPRERWIPEWRGPGSDRYPPDQRP